METRRERTPGARAPREGRRYDGGGLVDSDGGGGLGAFADWSSETPAPVESGGLGDLYNALMTSPAPSAGDQSGFSSGPFLADHFEQFYPGLLDPELLDGLRQSGVPPLPPWNTNPSNGPFSSLASLTGADADQFGAAASGQPAPEQYAAAGSAQAATRDRTSLDLNNPASLHDDRSPWQGKVGVTNQLVEFNSMENGLRAAALNLLNQQCLHGLTRIEDIIPKFATEADHPAYIKNVHNWMGTTPGQQLDLRKPGQLRGLLGAVVRHENGLGQDGQPRFDDETLNQAVGAAYEESRQSHPECWQNE